MPHFSFTSTALPVNSVKKGFGFIGVDIAPVSLGALSRLNSWCNQQSSSSITTLFGRAAELWKKKPLVEIFEASLPRCLSQCAARRNLRMVSARKEHKHKSSKAQKSEKNKKKALSDSSSSSSSSADEGAQRSRRRKRSRIETALPRAAEPVTVSSINAARNAALPQELRLLVNMLFAFPSLPTELAELLHALDSGESVCLDGVGDAALKRQLSEFLVGVGVRTDAAASGSLIFKPRQKAISDGDVTETLVTRLAAMLDAAGLVTKPEQVPDFSTVVAACIDIIDTMSKSEGMEDIGNEISQLMQQLLDGEIIIIDDLPDEQLKQFMLHLFTTLHLHERESIDGKGYGIHTDTVTVTDTSQATSALYVTAVKQAVQGVMAAYSSNPSEVERPDMTAPFDNNDNNNSEKSK
eukprot:18037-Heterococcus_DN1.PRE.1